MGKSDLRGSRKIVASPGFLGLPTFRRLLLALRKRYRERGKARPSRPRTSLSLEGIYFVFILLFVFAAALFGDVNLLIVLAGMLVGILAINWRLVARTLAGIRLRRRMPSRIHANDLLVVQVDLANTRRRGGSWAIAVRERIEYHGKGRGRTIRPPVLFFSYVPARQSRYRVYRARLPQRGRYRFAAPAVSTRYPFGLCRRTVILGEQQELIVYPRLGRLMPRWLARRHESFEGASRREQRHGTISGEFYGVRPWRQGDVRRHIHWRSSARHGTLVVRQYEQHRNRDVMVLLDLWQPSEPEVEHLENVELAVSFTATVVADICRRGGGNLLLATTEAPRDPVHGPASPALMDESMERLAVAEAASEDRIASLVKSVLGAFDPGTEVVLVTTRHVDLADTALVSAMIDQPLWRSVVARTRVISTSDATELASYFQVE